MTDTHLAGVLATLPTLDTLGLIADELGLTSGRGSGTDCSSLVVGGEEAPLPAVVCTGSNWTVFAEHQELVGWRSDSPWGSQSIASRRPCRI